MILYRIQISAEKSWTVEWYADEETALGAYERACTDLPRDIYLDEIPLPDLFEQTMTLIMNRAQVERTNWPGTNLKKRLGRSGETARQRQTLKGLL